MMLPHISTTRSSFSTSLIIILLIFILSLGGSTRVTLPKNVHVPAVIAFGDSIVDQGANNNLNTILKANFAPYGKDFVAGQPSGRFTNNKTPADLIVEELGIKDILPAYLDPSINDKELLTGVSFASGGSGYDPETSKIVSVLSFEDQLKQFKEYIEKLEHMVGEEKTQYILANSIFLVVAGSDDLANTYFIIGIRKLQYDIPSYADLMVSSGSNFIQEIYKLGARRIAVFGAPPIGCLPSQRTLAGGVARMCKDEYNEAAQIYNSKLQPQLEYLNSTLAESRIVYVDIYNPLLDIIKHPKNYGFEVVDKGCCGTGNIEVAILCNNLLPTCSDDSKYLFWDSYHPTNRGYSILINQILGKYINDFF
ncbi:GDSL esterase/lipase EXL3-like [Rutidosis leptorrhynchoides]|uniref:GDSL esterase/lipase EXL3-like n=1 Tax=Rutidosis leptorrhynchoides TaxID=125765 RepID=UPI003A9A0DBC